MCQGRLDMVQWAAMLCLLPFAVSGCNGLQSLSSFKLPASGQTGTGYGQSTRAYSFPSGRPATFQAFKDRYQTVGASPKGVMRM